MIALALSLLLQAAPLDYGFIRATEDFAIDTIPRPIRFTQHVPPKIASLMLDLDDDCYKCRERARKALSELGDEAVPWMFWGLRAKQASIRYGCWLVLRGNATCRFCFGTRQCQVFRQDFKWTSYSRCMGCGGSDWAHADPDVIRTCKACAGSLDIADLRF